MFVPVQLTRHKVNPVTTDNKVGFRLYPTRMRLYESGDLPGAALSWPLCEKIGGGDGSDGSSGSHEINCT